MKYSYKVVLLTAMEFLRFRDMDGVEFSLDSPGPETSTTTGSDDVSGLGDSADELETPVARRDHLQEKGESGKYLKWLKVIGKLLFDKSGRAYYISISEKRVLPFAVLLVGMMYTAIAVTVYFK